jgi:hypothetical protein
MGAGFSAVALERGVLSGTENDHSRVVLAVATA